MKYGLDKAEMISANLVFLDQQNPRHEPFEDQDDVIDYLCREEQVLSIARDIASNGLNPLELFALIPEEGGETYFAAEGNRRLCAIKLLNDPDLAPADFRNDIAKASENWRPINELFCVVFDKRDEVRLWLDRIHAGQDDGRGRRQWRAEQKARNSLYSKNDLALAVLDAAEQKGLINPEERKGRLSTVQRYLGNPLMRDALGLDAKDGLNLTTDIPEDDFDVVFRKFVRDIAEKKIHTRDNADKIGEYSRDLRHMDGVSGDRDKRREVLPNEKETKKTLGKIKKPAAPTKPSKIRPNDRLQAALRKIPSYKLEQIYFSICSLRLKNHPALLYVGSWSFIETLTAICGRNESTDFVAFLNAQTLEKLGLGKKTETKAIREAVARIAEFGNSTKHNKTAAGFNGEQLANYFETIDPLLLKLAEEARGKT